MTDSQNDDTQARFSSSDNIIENEFEQPDLMAIKKRCRPEYPHFID
jgi:hypothetical protein